MKVFDIEIKDKKAVDNGLITPPVIDLRIPQVDK